VLAVLRSATGVATQPWGVRNSSCWLLAAG